jgi:hypothetical protein
MSYYSKHPAGAEHPNSFYIQRKRCYERILKNKKCPTDKAIAKYGILFDDQDRIIIPEDLRKPKLEAKIAPKPMKAQESIDYLMTHYKPNGADPKPDSIKKYKQLTAIITQAGGDPENIVPTLEKPDLILEDLKKRYENKETLKQKWQVLLTHVDNVPMGLDKELIHTYKVMFDKLKQTSKETTNNKRKEESVYRWDHILEATDKLDPLVHFFFRMYDEIPIRSEFSHNIPVVHQKSDEPKEGNFVLDRGGYLIELHLRDWKTKGEKYPDEIVYKFSTELCKLFRKRGVGNYLLPGITNWAEWVKENLSKAGFSNFPYGTPDFPLKDIASGLRKTLASFRNSTFNTGKPKGAELAGLMLHDLGTGQNVYWHDSFITM